MNIFVTYSTPNYFKARDFAGRMAKRFGKFDKVVLYSPDDIDVDFKRNHNDILSVKRGAGLWLWKPYSFYKALCEEANDGDYVFYCDAATFFIRNCKHIINTIDESDIWVADNRYLEEQFTKEDLFHLLDSTEESYRKSNQIQAHYICARKSKKSMQFAKDWLDYACDIDYIGPENTKLGLENCEAFECHRFDQSILSLLSKKYEIKPHLCPFFIGYPNKRSGLLYRNGEPILEREYPCCMVLQHSPTVDYVKSITRTMGAWLLDSFSFLRIK